MTSSLARAIEKLTTAIAVSCCLAMSITAQAADKASCKAEVFVPESLKENLAVASPDGRYRVELGGYREERDSESGWLRVLDGKRSIRQYALKDLSGGIFVKWAPNSEAFYFMWSNGGMLGGYELRVFRVRKGTVREVPAIGQALREFTKKHHCHDRGENIFAVRWMENSDQLLIATQVYPTSDCGKEAGFTKGYLVRIDDGVILRRYIESEIEEAMKTCPSDIYPTGLWGKEELNHAKATLKVGPKTN